MNNAEIAWLVAGGIVIALICGFVVVLLPELRRLLRMKKM